MQTVGAQGYMQPTPSASAVNIQIFEPKAYAAPQTPAQVQNPVYAYPQTSMYAQPYMNQYQQYMPQPYALPMAPQAQPPQQQMPAPVIEQQQAPVEQAPAQQAPVQPQAPAVDTASTQTQNPQNQVDVNALVAGLQNPDTKVQEDSITKIANLSQGEPAMQNAVLSEPVMRGLADIIKQDTSGLQGPSEAQIAAINKAASGQQLTPEEQALTEQLAPKTAADKNRVISMFTLAMLQKNQRDEIDRYNATQDAQNQVPQLPVNDLIGYNEIENAARNEQEKEVKLAAIQALSYVARPEDKQALEPVFQAALQDPEPLIQSAASEALANIGSTAAPAQGQNQTQAQEPEKKLSRKERKALEKAQKEAQKQAEQAQKAQGAA